MRRGTLLVATVAGALAVATPAGAAVVPTRADDDIANAIVKDPTTLRGAQWLAIPPGDGDSETTADDPTAIIDAPLAGFPQDGTTAALLTTGGAELADNPNQSGGDGVDLGGENNFTDGSGVHRGDTAYDVTILKLDLIAPANTNCLSFQFRYASDEYPEYVGTLFNDAFIAELDQTSWTTSGATISAPKNFAIDAAGNGISINATGGESVAPQDAAGTIYDAATQVLQASVPAAPGDHSLYLSIFDQGDNILDAAAFVDNLTFTQKPAGGCESGAVAIESNPPVSTTSTQIPQFTKSRTIEFVVTDGPRGSGPRAVHYRLNGGEEQVVRTTGVPGKAIITLPDGKHTLEYWGEDRRGNQEATHHTANVVIDNAAPVLTLTKLQNVRFFEGAALFLVVQAADPLSGLKVDPTNPRFALDTNTAGPKMARFTATDNAQNTSTAAFPYTVRNVAPRSIISMQKARGCVSRRRFRIQVNTKPEMVIVSTAVRMGSKGARTFKGKRATAPINLRGITGKREVKVSVTVTTSTGKTFTLTRKYRTCAGGR